MLLPASVVRQDARPEAVELLESCCVHSQWALTEPHVRTQRGNIEPRYLRKSLILMLFCIFCKRPISVPPTPSKGATLNRPGALGRETACVKALESERIAEVDDVQLQTRKDVTVFHHAVIANTAHGVHLEGSIHETHA